MANKKVSPWSAVRFRLMRGELVDIIIHKYQRKSIGLDYFKKMQYNIIKSGYTFWSMRL